MGHLVRSNGRREPRLAQPANPMPGIEASALLFVASCLSNQFARPVTAKPSGRMHAPWPASVSNGRLSVNLDRQLWNVTPQFSVGGIHPNQPQRGGGDTINYP